jgi:hypothetical protein
MKIRIKWIVALVAVVVGVAWLLGDRVQAEGQEAPAEGDRVAELEREVQALRETLARMEQRLAAVEEKNGVRVLQFTDDAARRLQPQMVDPRVPWMQKYRPQGEINGIPYYVIPLKNQPATTQPAVVPPPADGQP